MKHKIIKSIMVFIVLFTVTLNIESVFAADQSNVGIAFGDKPPQQSSSSSEKIENKIPNQYERKNLPSANTRNSSLMTTIGFISICVASILLVYDKKLKKQEKINPNLF